MAWKKPEFLKTRAEKRRDNQMAAIGLGLKMVEVAVNVRRTQEAMEERQLKRDQLELENEKLRQQI